TLGESGVEHSLLQSEPEAVFVDPHLFKTVTGPLAKSTSVKYVIYNDDTHLPVPDSQIEQFRQPHQNLTVLSFEELLALGQETPTVPVQPAPEDVYCIMCTSGSTGAPKGVPVTHAAFVSAVAG